MTKKLFKIITHETYDFIPDNVIIINDSTGLVYMANKNKVWYTNSKSFNKEEVKEFKKNEVKMLEEFITMLNAEIKTI